jgi:hypothetical protein
VSARLTLLAFAAALAVLGVFGWLVGSLVGPL